MKPSEDNEKIVNMKLSCFFKSFLFFVTTFFQKRHYDVIFYYPSHFNREKNRENSYFKPFYDICDQNGINYLVIEEPEFFKVSKRNDTTVPFDFMLLAILVLRKLIPLKRFDSFEHREWFIARLLKPIFFRKFTFDNYMVLSGSLLGFFRGLNKDARLFEYQHGVITSSHRGYITEDGCTTDHIKLNNVHVSVYGEGFKEVLQKATKDEYYMEHVEVFGQSFKSDFMNYYGSKTILFSLQFADPNPKLNQQIFEKINTFFTTFYDFFTAHNIVILLKHHPRFQHDIDPSPLYDYPFTELCEDTLIEGLKRSFLHITFHSTTTFEAASIGIPTLLFENTILDPKFFVDDYAYPLGIKNEKGIIDQIEIYLSNPAQYAADAKEVYDWHHRFYQPVDEERFVSCIKSRQ